MRISQMDPKQLALEKKMLPGYPRTPHLPYKPNAAEDDIVAEESETAVLYGSAITIEEKIDGASVGISILDGHPIVRNRDHVLKKGFVKDTAAKKQFTSLWNYFYENEKKFQALDGYTVFGEWMFAQHGIHYTRLPEFFIPYDLYDYDKGVFLPPMLSRMIITRAGFHMPTLHYSGIFNDDYEELEEYANLPAAWADGPAEGIYIKVYDGTQILHRFKMVREDFQRGCLWDSKKIRKNSCLT